jgi:predicted RNA-binding Zn-ribbon protein involved in translation (DUF1610 family)
MSCPSCGKTLAAPDSAAGKKAKCPSCGQVMIVPAAPPAQEAGPPAQPPSPAASQPAASGAGNWLDDLGGAASAPGAGEPEAAGESRRPCPECGEMIVSTAAKCRFCGAIFDPHLKAKAKAAAGGDDSTLTTADWLLCIICSGIGCIMGIVYAIQGKPKGMKMVGISLVSGVFWGVVRAIIEASMHNGFR